MTELANQATLEKAGADPRYLALYRMACETYDARVRKGPPPADGKLIAYFSAEYGLTECLAIRSTISIPSRSIL
jgi:hypothetical protein